LTTPESKSDWQLEGNEKLSILMKPENKKRLSNGKQTNKRKQNLLVCLDFWYSDPLSFADLPAINWLFEYFTYLK